MKKLLKQLLWILLPLFLFGFIYAWIQINFKDNIEILGIPWSLTYFLISVSTIIFYLIIRNIREEV